MLIEENLIRVTSQTLGLWAIKVNHSFTKEQRFDLALIKLGSKNLYI